MYDRTCAYDLAFFGLKLAELLAPAKAGTYRPGLHAAVAAYTPQTQAAGVRSGS